MKRILLSLIGMLAVISLNASIVEWDWEFVREKYDFESDGFYFGIISESRGEVELRNRYKNAIDPYPSFWEIDLIPAYRSGNYAAAENKLGSTVYYEGDIEIPSVVTHEGREYKVVKIGYNAFAWSLHLTSVKLPPTIREIRYGAFSMCNDLKDINLPPGVIICGGAFYGCASLKEMDFSQCVFQYIEPCDMVVCFCTGLEKVTLPKNWYAEPYRCYLEECLDENGNFAYYHHHIIGVYFEEFDDFPYTEKCEEHGVCSPYWGLDVPIRKAQLHPLQEDETWTINQWPFIHTELHRCNALREIHATSTVPLVMIDYRWKDSNWDALYDKCTLYVPKGSLEAYSTTKPWSNFKNIVEEEQASVEITTTNDADRGQEAMRQIYDLSGNLRATVARGVSPALSPGIYIERCGDNTRKLVIR